jgi:hypothetical protein
MRRATSGVPIFVPATPVALFAALAIACTSASSGPSSDQACADQVKARCAKTAECSTYLFHIRYGDEATCIARETIFCKAAFAAPSTGKTIATTQACTAAYPNYSCADWLRNDVPAPCVPPQGALGNAATCQMDGQCASGFCAVPLGFGCGKCAPKTSPGDSCASNGICATESTGQYCSAGTMRCTTPVEQGGACDNNATLCASGLSCAGLTMTSNGTCQPALTALGADCVGTGQGGVGCDRHHGLVCDFATKKCIAMTFAAPGQPCGIVNNDNTPCDDQGSCLIPSGQKAGICVGVAADGAACDDAHGPMCAYRSSCIVSSGTTGTCTPIGSASCP